MSKRLMPLLVLLTIVSLILGGCAPKIAPEQAAPAQEPAVAPEKPADTPQEAKQETKDDGVGAAVSADDEAKTLRINLNNGFPDIIDPQKSSFLGELAHLMLMYEGLTSLNTSGEVTAGAAERWEVNDDASEWTFYLRDGLTYSDGSVLNAKRFQWAILRNINPETAGEYGYITDEILGAEAWRYGETEDEISQGQQTVLESVSALRTDGSPCESYDDPEGRILKITLKQPAPYFDSVAALWVTYPVKEEILEANGEDWWIDPANHVGNGPYVLTELESHVRGHFTPNTLYHRGVGHVDIEFSYITESAIVFQAYQNDEFDIITVAAEDLETVLADENIKAEYLNYAGSCTFGFIFNIGKEPFNDPKVRQAFSMALDRDAYVEDVLRGLGLSTLTWIPDGFPGHKDGETRWGFDADAARLALAESTYGSAEALPKIVDTYPDTARNRLRHEWLAAQFKDVLNINVELNPVEPTTYSALTKDIETAPQMFLLGWCADYPDPQNWLSAYWKTGAQAWSMVGYSNPDLDALLTNADSTLDRDTRMKLYGQAQDMIIDDCPAAFVYHTVQAFLVKPWVLDYEPNPMDFNWPGSFDPIIIDIDPSMMP